MATFIQPFVDQENANSVNARPTTKSSSKASRPIVGKTFSSSSTSLIKPPRAFRDISNVPSRSLAEEIADSLKRLGFSAYIENQPITLKKPTRTPGTQSTRKLKSKPKSRDDYPPTETMHIYEDKLPDIDVLPAEDRLSNLDLLTCSMPTLQTGVSDVDDIVPDFSLMSLYPQERTDPESTDVQLPSGSPLSECLFDLPSIADDESLGLDSLLKDLEI